MRTAYIYACGLTLLGAWGVYAMRRPFKRAPGWSWRRRIIVLVDALFVASCLGCAAALWAGRFQAWMAAAIGTSYLLMIPLPCYFESVDRLRWLHAGRNAVFVAVALFLFSIAAGLIPLSLLGLP